MALTLRGPSDDIDGLGVFAQSRQVINFAVFPFPVYFPYLSVPSAWAQGRVKSASQGGPQGTYSHIVISAGGCKSPLAVRLEVC